MDPSGRLAQIRYVTANYSQLQGLRLVPLGVALLLATPLYAGWHFAQSGLLLALWLLPLAVGLGLHRLVGAYYARTVGRVQPARRPAPGPPARLAHWLGWAVFVAVLVGGPRLGSPRLTLIGFSVLVCATLLASLWQAGHLRPRLHWLLLAALLAGVNLLLLTPLPLLRPDRWSDDTLFALWVGSVSLGLIVGGLLDHRLLMRAVTPIPEERHAATV